MSITIFRHFMQETPVGRVVCMAIAVLAIATSFVRADRREDFKKLEATYQDSLEKWRDSHKKRNENPTAADLIRNYDDWPVWQFIPKFLALAEANPADDVAYDACQWIFEKCFAGDNIEFAAEQNAWPLVAAHHATGDRCPELCLQAAQVAGPAREQFLRDLLKQPTISKAHAGYATLALAELLTKRIDSADYCQKKRKPTADDPLYDHLQSRYDPAYVKYLSGTDVHATKSEIAQLLRIVVDRYGDVPNSLSKPDFRDMKTLADKAKKSLHALEHLYVGAEAPDIVGTDLDGRPLKLADFRGRVVVLSFWFTGCGPCMAMIPEERKLIEKFKGRSFSLLGICGDEDCEQAKKTAAEENITWPCWFGDGTHGPICRDYNITGWPTFYILDQNGRIIEKEWSEEVVSELLDKCIGGENSSDTKPRN